MYLRRFFKTSTLIAVFCFASAIIAPSSNSKVFVDEVNPSSISKASKIDVWDFGAVQLDVEQYNNMLSVETINAWYPETVTPGSSGNNLPASFTSGILSWTGGGNDRLRTTNTSITRYDENIASVSGYTGRIYVNSAANPDRYLSLNLAEDDEVKIFAKTDAGGNIVFQSVSDPDFQSDEVPMPMDLTEINFVAKATGTYRIFDNQGKPSYYRIYRKQAIYSSIAGTVDETQADGIPEGYSVVFTNPYGKTWESMVNNGSFSVDLPAGYTYQLSLAGANGYIINNGGVLVVTESTTAHSISIQKVDLFNISGSIIGLDSNIDNLTLVFTPDETAETIYLPIPEIDYAESTYSVMLEPSVEYTISALGVNDYYIAGNTITIGNEDEIFDLTFTPKPVYGIAIEASGLDSEQLEKLQLLFTNLNEEGYIYSFSSGADIELRDGIYMISCSGLDEYPIELGLTSNLKVEGEDTGKILVFKAITNWSFDDKAIETGTTAYNGLIFTGNISNELVKGHLLAKPGATIQVPVNPSEKIVVTYYYSADFTIEGGDQYTTSSGSTSTLEYASYAFAGTEAGYVTIAIGSSAGTTYIKNIAIGKIVDYAEAISVGEGKDYQTINEALEAVRNMERPDDERVIIMVDPGNYEEMLVIDQPNITLKNAAANPSIELTNKGVDIADGAVRVTSYYGHGYSYFSMDSDQKWDADVLRVNKENGYHSYDNSGAGTTNGSYWNATVVVMANGFIAEDIIFENSFNQYISQKEADDVLVLWKYGSKGQRPTDIGNTDVQDKEFVERAAAIAITDNTDKVILNKCRVIGRQDSFFGGSKARVVVYKGAMMGAVDFIFGGMTAVFYKSDFVMNTSDNSNDRSYITAAQQSSGRGYLMYECNIKSALPETESASTYLSKPGYFGRPWLASTSEVVFYNTTIGTSNYPGFENSSLIMPEGWLSSLSGESPFMYEYGTIEISGENNQGSRADWSTVLTSPTLLDGTEITPFNFTKGDDDWDPLPDLISGDVEVGVDQVRKEPKVIVYSFGNKLYISNVQTKTRVNVFNVQGLLVNAFATNFDTHVNLDSGLWIVQVNNSEGHKAVKVYAR